MLSSLVPVISAEHVISEELCMHVQIVIGGLINHDWLIGAVPRSMRVTCFSEVHIVTAEQDMQRPTLFSTRYSSFGKASWA